MSSQYILDRTIILFRLVWNKQITLLHISTFLLLFLGSMALLTRNFSDWVVHETMKDSQHGGATPAFVPRHSNCCIVCPIKRFIKQTNAPAAGQDY